MITRPKDEKEMEQVLLDAFADWEDATENFSEENTLLPDFEVKTIEEHKGIATPEKGVVFIQGETSFIIQIKQIHYS